MNISRIIYKLFWQQISSGYLAAGAFIFVVVFVFLFLSRKKFLNSLAVAALCAYLFLVFSVTIFARTRAAEPIIRLRPFWSYHKAIFKHNTDARGQILRNCLLLFPAGFLLFFCYYPRRIKLRWVLLSSLAVSYTIELLQLLFHKGTFELVDDPFDNMIGAAAGFLLASLLVWLANQILQLYHKWKKSQ